MCDHTPALLASQSPTLGSRFLPVAAHSFFLLPPPEQVLMTGDGSRVVTLSKDATGRVWDADSGLCLHVLGGRV